MQINLGQIYSGLEAWRAERGLTAESQRRGFITNIMEEMGELAQALRDYEKFSKSDSAHDLPNDLAYYDTAKKVAEHQIVDALCDISVFTINAGGDLPASEKITTIYINEEEPLTPDDFNLLVYECGGYSIHFDDPDYFNDIVWFCAHLCKYYGFNYEVAMDETIKEISSRTGSYNEASKKWVKDTSEEAKAKWYKANYDLARL